MSLRFRKNIVGKRFFAVSASEKLRKNNVKGWPWISGYIRAASLRDSEDEKIQVQTFKILDFTTIIILFDPSVHF